MLLEDSSPPIPAESDLIPSYPLYFFGYVSSIQYMYYTSNTFYFLLCNSVPPTLEKNTSTPFVWLTPNSYSTEDSQLFDYFFFSSGVPSVSPKEHMSIHSPVFDYLTLFKTYLLPIIFDTGAILFISL